eukprot:3835936-Pyramimonas_sp.AAC.1
MSFGVWSCCGRLFVFGGLGKKEVEGEEEFGQRSSEGAVGKEDADEEEEEDEKDRGKEARG